jgi:hypothetical protein
MKSENILQLFGINGTELETMLSLAGVNSNNISMDVVNEYDEVLGTLIIRNGKVSVSFGNGKSKLRLKVSKP